MAAEVIVKKSLVLSIEEGMDDKGNPIHKRYTYSNIKSAASPDNLLETAQALSSLYDGDMAAVSTVDTNEII